MSSDSSGIDVRTTREKLLKRILLETEANRPKYKGGYTIFNESKSVERRQQFVLNANIPLSNQRDEYTDNSINGGTVTEVGAEYRLRATSSTNSKGLLRTKQRGNYVAGNVSEGGIGVRPDAIPTGDAYMKWGPYDYNGGNRIGGYFHLDKNGLKVVLEDNGTIIDEFSQDNWNMDKMDEFTKQAILEGNVYQVVYGYYGYFPFFWEISKENSFQPHTMTPVHYYKRKDGNVSLSNPNLPLTAEVDSGTTGQQLDLYIGGRQYSAYGDTVPDGRHPEASRSLSGIGTSFVPLIAVKSKASLIQIVKKFEKIELIADNRGYWRITKGDAPTGGSGFQEIGNNYNPNETSILVDTTATTIGSDTETIGSGIFAGSNQASPVNLETLPDKELYDEEVYTLEIAADSTNVDMLGSMIIKTLW